MRSSGGLPILRLATLALLLAAVQSERHEFHHAPSEREQQNDEQLD
jgi:hypothetical protein